MFFFATLLYRYACVTDPYSDALDHVLYHRLSRQMPADRQQPVGYLRQVAACRYLAVSGLQVHLWRKDRVFVWDIENGVKKRIVEFVVVFYIQVFEKR